VANKIKSRLASLARCLDLDGSPGPFVLTDQVIPVVPVSSCLEKIAFGVRSLGAAAIVDTFSPVQVAGVYRISVCLSSNTAVAGTRVSYVAIVVGPTAAILMELATWRHGVAVGNETQFLSWELNLPDQWRLLLESEGTGVGNVSVADGVVQPL